MRRGQLKAIQDELIAQLINDTWMITERVIDRKIVGNRYVFQTKENSNKKYVS